jgi:membrane associated rhomboid family serine protease
MVLPLFDDNSDRQTTPFVNYALIGLNVFVFVVLQGVGYNNEFTYAFATVPYKIVTGQDVRTEDFQVTDPVTGRELTVPGLRHTPGSVYLTLLTSMCMHGGWIHLLGNLLFLWIFGDNIEDDLGHVRYLIFYLVCGLVASLAHVWLTVALSGLEGYQSLIPSLGASGAISGVLGAYLVQHPGNRVTVFLFRILTEVPAWVAIGMWFVFQIISSLGTFGKGAGGGVAYAAHFGGFLAGLALVKPFMIGVEPRRRAAW